jgi:RNA polymerase sigma factor (sigma-70 family)
MVTCPEIPEDHLRDIIRICYYWAKKRNYHNGIFDDDDLAQEAIIRVMLAYRRWDPAKGKLTTWASYISKGTIASYIRLYQEDHRRGLGFKDHEILRYSDYDTDEADFIPVVFSDVPDVSHRLQILDSFRAFSVWSRLRNDEKFVLKCRWGYGYTERDVAAMMQTSHTTIWNIEKSLMRKLDLPRVSKRGSMKAPLPTIDEMTQDGIFCLDGQTSK